MGDRVGDGSTALAAAAAVGPYFVWTPLPPRSTGWRPLADLAGAAVEELVPAARVRTATGAGLTPDALPLRAVASVWFLGLVSRLVSAPLAAVALAEVLPEPPPAALWWRADGGTAVAVSTVDARSTARTADEVVADRFAEAIITPLTLPLAGVLRQRYRLSPKVLHGNIASALGGAVTVLARERPERADRAGRIVAALLADGPLRGSATVRPGGRSLRRRNCCLYYRLPGGGLCGDCVLRAGNRPVRKTTDIAVRRPGTGGDGSRTPSP